MKRDRVAPSARPGRGPGPGPARLLLLSLAALCLTAPGISQDAADSPEKVRAALKTGQYAEAEGAARRCLGTAEASHGVDSAEAAAVLDLLVEALWKGGKASEPATLESAEKAVTIKQMAFGPSDPEVATSLNNLGSVLRSRGDYEKAGEVHRRALEIREKTFGPVHPDVATSLNNIAAVHYDLGDDENALTIFERVMDIRQKTLAPEDPLLGRTYNNVGVLKMNAGRYDESMALLEKALAVRTLALGADHPDVAETHLNFGILLRRMGRVEEAAEHHRTALAIRERSLGADHPEVAKSLTHLAILLGDQGEYGEAKPLLERALRIREARQGPQHPEVAETLNVLGNLLASTGDFADARVLHERALAIREKAHLAESSPVAQSLANIAYLLLDLHDYAGARPYSERSLRIREALHTPDSPDLALGLDLHATVLAGLGETAEARALRERALSIRETTFGPMHPEVAESVLALSQQYGAAGEAARALPLAERAQSIYEAAYGPAHPGVAASLNVQAALLERSDRDAEALAFYERALRSLEDRLGPAHPDVGRTLAGLARVEWRRADKEAAVAHSLRAEAILREHLVDASSSLSEREALAYERVRSSGLDVAMSALAAATREGRREELTRRVWDQVIRSRALVFDEISERHRRLLEAESTQVITLRNRLESSRASLANLVTTGPDRDRAEEYRVRLEEARARKENLERALARESGSFRNLQIRRDVRLDDVRRALPAGGTLVAFSEYRDLPRPVREDGLVPDGIPSYLAFIMRADAAQPACVPLGPARAIDALVHAWRESVSAPPEDRDDVAEERRRGSALRRAIWDPLAPHLGSKGSIFVVADGALNLVNLLALPVAEDRYLVENARLIHSLSAERDLVALRESAKRGTGLLVLGGPDFDAGGPSDPPMQASAAPVGTPASACPGFHSLAFPPLPGARMEAEEVVAIWNGRAAGSPGPQTDAVLLTGERAREEAFKRHAPGRRVLHLATHGFFAPSACLLAPLDAMGLSRSGPSPADPLVAGENPLLLSGLALTGANRRDQRSAAGMEDGILTAEEVASLDLRGVEWAVLSGCDTGAGPVLSGEGVLGLRRTFAIAGARTLILSLWSIDDQAGRTWIRGLYEARLSGLSTPAAVRKANLDAIQVRRRAGVTTHPFFWGPFVASGDWR